MRRYVPIKDRVEFHKEADDTLRWRRGEAGSIERQRRVRKQKREAESEWGWKT
jgi:hypothetical protein